MLIRSYRHTADDLDRWSLLEQRCEIHAQLKSHRNAVQRAKTELFSFTGADSCYAGTSWGKDSVVVAHLVATLVPRIPLVWVRVEPRFNPDCLLVRDEFLRRFPAIQYEEITVHCVKDESGWHARGTLEAGFEQAEKRYGAKYISGIRGDESANRARRMSRYGERTVNTCAPIGRFSGWDVFAYLHAHRLPIHPAYACTMGGAFEHERIRVATLGGKRGDGMGRAAWEWEYYREELCAMGYGKYDVRQT
jgi:phosphoadenosine phosphosulfate reductase